MKTARVPTFPIAISCKTPGWLEFHCLKYIKKHKYMPIRAGRLHCVVEAGPDRSAQPFEGIPATPFQSASSRHFSREGSATESAEQILLISASTAALIAETDSCLGLLADRVWRCLCWSLLLAGSVCRCLLAECPCNGCEAIFHSLTFSKFRRGVIKPWREDEIGTG